MKDNNPNSWPPSPETSETEAAKKPRNHLAGRRSLIMAVLAALTTFLSIFSRFPYDVHQMPVFLLCMALWLGIAAVLGIIGWRSRTGKIALVIILLVVLFFVQAWTHPPPPHYF